MQYLILKGFRSYGKFLRHGDVVDESEIRAPHLRRSEGKIIPAVSSTTVPAEFGDTEANEAPADVVASELKPSEEAGVKEDDHTVAEQPAAKPLFAVKR